GMRIGLGRAAAGFHRHQHAGHEFGFVLAGEVELVVDSTKYVLKAGDSFAFKSTLLHAFRNPGAERCQILWVNTTKPSEVRDGA
ncbi:cupin domain-containing protein, partial [Mesorhizobium sp. M7A.F.Ca.AU.002.02.1.1]|uniref:cupin domain-containing protein n=1 Tax=Mesorhizobium sp. M7A.F.Ca.AU.002.02.1.1 TaxID=2496671 RepID=UPI000FD26BF0